MNENYLNLTSLKSSGTKIISKIKGITLFCALMLLVPVLDASAQMDYTLGTGGIDNSTLGVTPFSTSNLNSRSQYLYLAEELLAQGATSGNIIAFSMNVTSLALPASMRAKNVTVKIGSTSDVVLGQTLVPNLPVFYTTAVLEITALGWYKIDLNMPFEWDGEKNIILEICRNNDITGTSYGVQSTLFNQTDYRTAGLYSNSNAIAGCNLTGQSPMIFSDRRNRPNIRFTMTNPCTETPTPSGTVVISSGASCNGTPFVLSVANGATESGLAYQWESAANDNGPWLPIMGAVYSSLTTSQSVATWYRRSTFCVEAGMGIYTPPVQVGGAGCYCTAGSTNVNSIGITNVSFNTINNTSSTESPFTNFTTITTTVNRGETYPLSVFVNTVSGANYTNAWIDWNANGVFDASELISLGNVTGGTNVNSGAIASVTVPLSAVIGNTVMRVRTKQSAANDYAMPCGLVENGESEDYTINVDVELGTNSFVTNGVDVIAYAYADGLKVAINQSAIQSVSVYDISGRLVSKKQQLNQQEIAIPLAMKGQIVIVKVTTSEGVVLNKKVILN